MIAGARVAFVSHSLRLYGASRSLLALLEGLRAAGVAVHAFLPGPGPMADALAARDLPATITPFPNWVTEAPVMADTDGWRAATAEAVTRLAAELERFRPDAVWSNTSVTPVGAQAAAALGLPHIWHLREINGEPSPFRYLPGDAAAMRLMRAATARIAVSRAVRAAYEQAGSGPCEVIYSSIGTAADLARRPLPAPRGGPLRLLLPARVRPEKGQLAAIDAVRLLIAEGHAVQLRLAGDGDLEPCRQAIARRGLTEAVSVIGFVADLDGEYRDADAVLSTSPIEGMGRTTAEAMAYGLPVIGCAALGTPELLEHEVTGLLCDGSPAGIAAAVRRLLREPALARALGDRARRVARERFTDERCTAACLAVLARVLRNRTRADRIGGPPPGRLAT